MFVWLPRQKTESDFWDKQKSQYEVLKGRQRVLLVIGLEAEHPWSDAVISLKGVLVLFRLNLP